MPASRRPAPAWEPNQPLVSVLEDWQISERYQYLRAAQGRDDDGNIIPPSAIIFREAYAAAQAQRLQEIVEWLINEHKRWIGPVESNWTTKAFIAEAIAAHFAKPETPKHE